MYYIVYKDIAIGAKIIFAFRAFVSPVRTQPISYRGDRLGKWGCAPMTIRSRRCGSNICTKKEERVETRGTIE